MTQTSITGVVNPPKKDGERQMDRKKSKYNDATINLQMKILQECVRPELRWMQKKNDT